MAAGLLSCFITAIILGIPAFPYANMDYYNLLFTKPWGRIFSYTYGVMFGVISFEFLRKTSETNKRYGYRIMEMVKNVSSRGTVGLFVLAIILIEIPLMFQYYNLQCLPEINAKAKYGCASMGFQYLYILFSKPLFLTGAALLLALCITNKIRWLKMIIGSYVWGPLQELSYSAYMVHFLIIMWFYNSTR